MTTFDVARFEHRQNEPNGGLRADDHPPDRGEVDLGIILHDLQDLGSDVGWGGSASGRVSPSDYLQNIAYYAELVSESYIH